MTRKTIPVLSADACKADEIAYLELVASTLPADSYLKSLLSEQLVAWASKHIRDDVAPDLYDSYMGELRASANWHDELCKSQSLTRELTATSSAALERAQLEINRLTGENDRLRATHATALEQRDAEHFGQVDKQIAKCDLIEMQLDDERKLTQSLRSERDKLMQQIVDLDAELEQTRAAAHGLINARDAQIGQLRDALSARDEQIGQLRDALSARDEQYERNRDAIRDDHVRTLDYLHSELNELRNVRAQHDLAQQQIERLKSRLLDALHPELA